MKAKYDNSVSQLKSNVLGIKPEKWVWKLS